MLVGEEALLKRVKSMEMENTKLRRRLEEVYKLLQCSFVLYWRCFNVFRVYLKMKDIRYLKQNSHMCVAICTLFLVDNSAGYR